MRKREGPLCRLCLGVVSNENIGEIGENIKEILEVLQLKPNFHFSEEDIVCSDCMRSIQECLDLKLTYQNVEDFIVALYSKSKSKLDLREVYIQKNKYMTTTDIATNQKICRFCIKLHNISSCNSLITIEVMIQKCVPELNFNLTKDPVICDSCLDSLKIYFQFLQICVDTEEKIMKYLEFEATGSKGPINLNKVVQFTKNISNNERDITKINVYPDMLCCEANENNVIKSEVTDKKENAEFDTENFENDIKTNVEKNVKIELKEESGVLHNGELEMIYEQNELHNIVKSEVVVERVSAKFDNKNVENCIKIDVEKNIINMEIKVESFELQNEKLEIIDEENELQAEQIDFERLENGIVLPQSEPGMRLHGREKYLLSNLEEEQSKPCIKSASMSKNNFHPEMTMYNCASHAIQPYSEYYLKNHLLKDKDPSEVKMHELTHKVPSEVPMYKCYSCPFQTKYEYSIKTHLLCHKYPSEVTMYKCDSCSYQTKHKYYLKSHLLIHKDPSEVPMYKCYSCPFQAKHKDYLKKHLLRHRDPSEVTMYKCDSCSFRTRFKTYLKRHSLKHKDSSEVTMYKCHSCSFQTKYKQSLTIHLREHKDPSEVTMYKCNSCSYETKYKGDLKQHDRKMHLVIHKNSSEIKMYKCKSCSFQTRHSGSLSNHFLMHKDPSDVTWYKCATCSFQTKYKHCLIRHLQEHKDPSEVTMYKCDSCSYHTKHKHSFKKHMVSHEQTKQTLKMHAVMH